MNSARITLYNLRINKLNLRDAAQQILIWCNEVKPQARLVVTPNLYMAVVARRSPDLRLLLNNADMSLADGMPLVWASRLFGKRLPERVTGSDLPHALCELSGQQGAKLRLFLLGAGAGVAEHAGQRLEQQWPHVTVAGCYSPPYGFERDERELARILDKIATAQPDILLVGLGFPKQEKWATHHLTHISAKVVICVGATLDFLAGQLPRAPVCMQRCGLEWLYRLLREPGRLASRYAYAAAMLPILLWDESRQTRDP